jgi:hypothetical protein
MTTRVCLRKWVTESVHQSIDETVEDSMWYQTRQLVCISVRDQVWSSVCAVVGRSASESSSLSTWNFVDNLKKN